MKARPAGEASRRPAEPRAGPRTATANQGTDARLTGHRIQHGWIATIAATFVLCALGLLRPTTGQAQVYQRLPLNPPTMLPPLPDGPVGDFEQGFDAFAPTRFDNRYLRPWQTIEFPLGTWGSELQWDPHTLGATTIQRYRRAFVQKTQLRSGYIYRNSDANMGYTFASASVTMVVPLGSEDKVVALTPRYRVDWIDGPNTVDVPARLHSASFDLGMRIKFDHKWTMLAGVQPGWYNDQFSADQGTRIGALVVVVCDVIPEKFQLTAGVARLDRNDYDIVPVVGATLVPNPDTRFELTFPKPKIARRIGHIPCLQEDWIYLSAFFGGGTWSVRRTTGLDDELTLRDFRVSLGVERVINGGTGFNLEMGYVFGRRLEYEFTPLTLDFDDSFIIEAGLSF